MRRRVRRSRPAARPSSASGGSSTVLSPTAWRKPVIASSPSLVCRRASGEAREQRTLSNVYTKSSSGGSKRRPCCHRRIPLPCCSGRCSPPARSTCARSMAGRRSPQSPLISRLTSQPETISSCCRRSRHAKFQPHRGRHLANMIKTLTRLVTYVHAPELIDAQAALNQLRLSFGGVLYIDGGWGVLAAGLAASATAAGATIRTQSSVTKVARQEVGWMVSGPGLEDHLASTVVLAVAPQNAASLVGQSPDLAAVVQRTKPVRLMCLDLGLSNLPNPDATYALGIDQPTYFAVHSTIARLAPSPAAMVHVARYLAPGESPKPAHFDTLEQLTDLLQPGWRDVEVQRQRLVGIVVAHDFPSFHARGRRGPITVQDAPGLFLAGDWIGAEGMLSDASAASART